MRLDAPWAPQAVAADASPGGHGMAYATVGGDAAAEWGRRACRRGEYSVLDGEGGGLPEAQHSQLQR
eukprot:5509450-Lingulodinium_polyedra.AAC.1